MELQFQQPQSPHQQHHYQVPITKPTKLKGRNKISSNSKNKYVGVRQRPSGRWVAEIKDTTHKIRMWLGTFKTAEEAATAYDEAASLLRGSNTCTNFGTHASPNSPLASRIHMLLDHKKLKKSVSRSTISFSPAKYHNSTITTTTTTSGITSTITTTTTSNNINPSTSSCSSINYAVSNGIATATLCNGLMQDPQLTVDEIYRPHFINECDESHLASAQFDSSCAVGTSMQIAEGCNMAGSNTSCQIAELDRIKMERQTSTSLSGMNELQDYFEMDQDHCDPWDLPLFVNCLAGFSCTR